MFENQTSQIILQRMLDSVDEWARERGITIDTREGSLIRTALSPAALEMQQMYIELSEVLNESFADTQTRDFLIRRCKERGIIVEPATFAIRRGEFNIDVPIGSVFSLNLLNYKVITKIEANAFELRCETAGVVGNLESGDLVPNDYVEGLTTAILTDILIPGEDEEATEHLRQRYYNSLQMQAYGGNIQDYIEKTLALAGVGGVKVYPVWNGGGTVKLVILNTQFQVPSPVLIDAVQTAIDPIQNQGLGLGVAPIGHTVTVQGVTGETVNVATHLTFESGWDWNAVKPYVEQAIDDYFTELAEEWDAVDWRNDPAATLTVRISQIETRFLGVTGILDVENTTLNSQAQNLKLGVNSIPVRGTVSNV
ncbi:MAG: baseplate J/gp47 family protein [Candidatus Fimivivens sp.]|nr:baseplate J/gp47 family protein [Candidatus Fimivivens sp.]